MFGTPEIMLWALIATFPLIDLGLSRLVRGRRLASYVVTALLLWSVSLPLLWLHANDGLSVRSLGLTWVPGGWSWLGVALCIAISIYAAMAVANLARDRATAELVARQMAAHQDLLPASRGEAWVFSLIVSVSAGFCEELVFRGYLLPLLRDHAGTFPAVALSSLAFGWWHLYLGASHMLRSAAMGAMFAVIVLLTDHLWIAIALHALIDIYSGALHYSARRVLSATNRTEPSMP
jgi:membrane protease YdiL (CAAX protease family)